jgi:hypothetical protein
MGPRRTERLGSEVPLVKNTRTAMIEEAMLFNQTQVRKERREMGKIVMLYDLKDIIEGEHVKEIGEMTNLTEAMKGHRVKRRE